MNRINIFLVILLISVSVVSCTQKEFIVKPNTSDSVELIDGKSKCVFTFTAVGGSSESWMIMIDNSGDNPICMIGRQPPPSYMVFKDFSASFINGNKHFQTVDMMDNEGSVLLNDGYKIENNKEKQNTSQTSTLLLTHKQSLYHMNTVVPGKSYNSNIALLTMTAPK
ncbi:hypothetical protein PPL_05249 [Heterostelium album PN500]|uniref:Lipoprotein n=1 Tax=Heterostelium pallidum (strain ATCC 26659 / Pp 5 / PN500) TaxID=670386 RepID=D3B9V2_HETP5|nr:hypothetical protein PPL_05249 [Heterostelium album PN500]EFA82014.1 hypothetical protein PPL_05249 [Heterostelium album PN500]|eukprot:XP_020434131.1 hypothetical protein PPL_05249 [Heterostelium album PN500]